MRDDSRAFKIKPKPDLSPSLCPHGMTQLDLIVRIKHQKTASSGPDELAARSPFRQGVIVPLVDFPVTHTGTAALLVLPVDIQEPGKFGDISIFEGAFG